MSNNLTVNHTIKLIKLQFPEFYLRSSELLDETATKAMEMEIAYGVVIADEKHFIVEFHLKLFNEKIKGQFKMAALFETDTVIDDEFKQSALVQVNAPAIAFPYLRSFVSTTTVNAGYNAVILPSINLTSLKR
ncbi:MAG: hypothetical protein RL329_2077 [Bacteroidota bacterium]|jgi:preprotein translocase subunit SecB